jgi:arylsulfatase A
MASLTFPPFRLYHFYDGTRNNESLDFPPVPEKERGIYTSMNSCQSRRQFLKTIGLLPLAYYGCEIGKQPKYSEPEDSESEYSKPINVVIIFLDDSGWADFRPFGDPDYLTPHVHQLAREGCCFNQFYVPQALCSASRASLLTGCYPGRTKVFSALPPKARGLAPRYATIAEVLKIRGYNTAIFGKWHVGDQPETRPPARGFDESCGLMYSNDMWKFNPVDPEYWGQWPLQYWENGEIKISAVTGEDQAQLTTWYTEHAVDFINRNKDNPFFLYVPHSMPHVPISCSEKYFGKSGFGLYADVIMELDWSVGQILEALKTNGLEGNTLVIFSSDNGPSLIFGNHAGKTPFREGKATSFDGGIRSACIIKYPKEIVPHIVSENFFCSIDILPTICYLTGANLPDNEIDGKNVWDLIIGKKEAQNPHQYYAFSCYNQLQGVISPDGRWKLQLPHTYLMVVRGGRGGLPGLDIKERIELSLFDMKNDPYEKINVIGMYPQIAAQLQEFAAQHKEKFYSGEDLS